MAYRRFCKAGYDLVGVRELAQEAKVDHGLMMRIFSSKEALFAEVAEKAFGIDIPFDWDLAGLGQRLADYMLGKAHADDVDGLDDFHFILQSAASPTAGPIIAETLHRKFVGPLASRLAGEEAEIRAAMLTAAILGFATMHVVLRSPIFGNEARKSLSARLGRVLQASVEP